MTTADYLARLRAMIDSALSAARENRKDAKQLQWEAGEFARTNTPADGAPALADAIKHVCDALGASQAPLHFENYKQGLVFLETASDLLGKIARGESRRIAQLRFEAECVGGPKDGEVFPFDENGMVQGLGFASMTGVPRQSRYECVARSSETRFRFEFRPDN
jgi:hypothetical protein